MHFKQLPDEWHVVERFWHAIADEIPDLETRRIEVEAEGAALSRVSYGLHCITLLERQRK